METCKDFFLVVDQFCQTSPLLVRSIAAVLALLTHQPDEESDNGSDFSEGDEERNRRRVNGTSPLHWANVMQNANTCEHQKYWESSVQLAGLVASLFSRLAIISVCDLFLFLNTVCQNSTPKICRD